jgi:hypothetical protein
MSGRKCKACGKAIRKSEHPNVLFCSQSCSLAKDRALLKVTTYGITFVEGDTNIKALERSNERAS